MIAGPVEAIVGTGIADPGAAEADRARLEKELGDAERLLDAARARLANEAFVSKAPPAIVDGRPRERGGARGPGGAPEGAARAVSRARVR